MSEKHGVNTLEGDPSPERDNICAEEMGFEEGPPSYSTLFTANDLQLPDYSVEPHESTILQDTGRFSIDLCAGNRTSALLQAFSVPAERPRMIEIPNDSPVSDESANGSRALGGSINMDGIALDIVFMLVGSRDEIKSIILVAKELQKRGHRIRIATHSIFQSFVTKLGMEFFSISNDPQHPIARNDSGLVPELSSSDRPQLQRSRKMLLSTLKSCWDACNHAGSQEDSPFIADAIIASPLAHAHVHCAERLSIPLHIISTSPWTPTRKFAHPLAQIETGSEVDRQIQNYVSYLLVEDSMQNEIHHVVNHFRQAILGLPTPSYPEGKSPLARFNIPHTYLWSSGLLPKPADWEESIDIAGYISSKASTPTIQVEEKLDQFLQSAENPLLVLLDVTQLNDPVQFLNNLKEASLRYGIYLILPKEFRIIENLPDLPTIFVMKDTPAEHIVSRVSVLLTSGSVPAINLAIEHQKPVLSMPLLRDQPFWATAAHNSGIGPAPILEKDFSSETFIESFRHCQRLDVQEAVKELGLHAGQEPGAINAVNCFLRHLRWEKTKRSPTGSNPAIYRMRLKGMAVSQITSTAVGERGGGAVHSVTAKDSTYGTEAESTSSLDKIKPTFFVEAKGVSRSLIKAIIKPTISHISDARSKFETENDVAVPIEDSVRKEVSKGDIAMKVARSVGFGSAVACGKIAILPFKTVYYMSETASYGIRALQKSPRGEPSRGSQERTDYFDQTPAQESATIRDADLHRSLQRDDAYSRAIMASRSATPSIRSQGQEEELHGSLKDESFK